MKNCYVKVSSEIARLTDMLTSEFLTSIDEMSDKELEMLQCLRRLVVYNDELNQAMIENEIHQTEMLEEMMRILKRKELEAE